jgi:hypothetical protein
MNDTEIKRLAYLALLAEICLQSALNEAGRYDTPDGQKTLLRLEWLARMAGLGDIVKG